jgi:hypothetical protein
MTTRGEMRYFIKQHSDITGMGVPVLFKESLDAGLFYTIGKRGIVFHIKDNHTLRSM